MRFLSKIELRHPDTEPTFARHLFRALLRECSYLPDPCARQYLHHYVVARFYANKARPPRESGPHSRRTQAILGRRLELLKLAQKGLKTLCRANYGHPGSLSKVLALTYGRVGPRRHELMKQLETPYPAAQTEEQVLANKPKDIQQIKQWRADLADQHVPLPSPQLNALIRSQASVNQDLFPRRLRRRFKPKIPERNSWNRLTPMKRVRNLKRQWYAEVMARVMPPLPEDEWELLRKKACGEVYLHHPLRRRGSTYDYHHIAREAYKPDERMSRPHVLNQRYMKRIWATIFRQCPLMKEDPTKPFGWHVVWPVPKADTRIGFQATAANYSSAFAGVDKNGRLTAPTMA